MCQIMSAGTYGGEDGIRAVGVRVNRLLMTRVANEAKAGWG